MCAIVSTTIVFIVIFFFSIAPRPLASHEGVCVHDEYLKLLYRIRVCVRCTSSKFIWAIYYTVYCVGCARARTHEAYNTCVREQLQETAENEN